MKKESERIVQLVEDNKEYVIEIANYKKKEQTMREQLQIIRGLVALLRTKPSEHLVDTIQKLELVITETVHKLNDSVI